MARFGTFQKVDRLSAEPEPEPLPESALEYEREIEESQSALEPALDYEREIEESLPVLESEVEYEEREIEEPNFVQEPEVEYEKREIEVEEPEYTSSYTSSSPLPVATEQQELYQPSASPTPGQCHYCCN